MKLTVRWHSKTGLTCACVAVLLATVLSSLVQASQVIVVRHKIDSTLVGVDTVPPAQPVFTVKSVRRGVGPRPLPDGRWTSSSADDMADAEFIVKCTDDLSKSYEIGYRLTLADGALPEGLRLPDEAYRTLGCGGIGRSDDCLYFLNWLEDPIDFQAPFDFTLTAVAIDKAGNESEPSEPIRVVHDGVILDPLLTAAIDSIAEGALEQGPIAGLSVAVVRGKRFVHVRGYGFADIEKRAPAGSHTVYDIASVSKVFTAIAIMRLVDEGTLSLDGTIDRYLHDFPNPEQAAKITIRHLLNHTSGLHDYEEADVERWLNDGTPVTPGFVSDFLRGRSLDFEPGTRWSYCNTGFYLLARIIQSVTQDDFAAVAVDRRSKYPLGMRETGLCDAAAGWPRAIGYDATDGDLVISRQYQQPGVRGDGGMCSSAYSLASLPAFIERTPMMAQMMEPTRLTNGVVVDYGFGLRLGNLAGHRVWGHTGGMETYWAVLARYPDDDLTIVVLVNTENASEDALTIEGAIAEVALGIAGTNLKDEPIRKHDARALKGWFADGTSRVRIARKGDYLVREIEGSGRSSVLRNQGKAVFGWDDYPLDRMVYHLDHGHVLGISEYYNGLFGTFRWPDGN